MGSRTGDALEYIPGGGEGAVDTVSGGEWAEPLNCPPGYASGGGVMSGVRKDDDASVGGGNGLISRWGWAVGC